MTWIRTYTISGDFGGNYNPFNFKTEILASSITTATVSDTGNNGNDINIIFDIEPTTEEKTILDGLIIQHNSVENTIYDNISQITIKNNTINTSSYKRLEIISYPGTNYTNTIKKITAVGYMESGITSYFIKIFNRLDNQIVAEQTFTNTTEEVLNLGTISNLPLNEAILEISVKKTGGNGNSKVYIESVSLYY